MPVQPILVVGSVALDDVRTPFGEVHEAFGGSASYFALAARFFAPVRLVAVVGRDFPERHLQLLRECNVDTRGLEVAEGACFRWGGEYGFDLNARTTLFTHLNVFEHFHPKVPQEFRDSPFVFLGNIHPTLQAEVLQGHISSSLCHLGNISYRTGRKLAFDPATETFPGDKEANSYLTRDYRKPFVVPERV